MSFVLLVVSAPAAEAQDEEGPQAPASEDLEQIEVPVPVLPSPEPAEESLPDDFGSGQPEQPAPLDPEMDLAVITDPSPTGLGIVVVADGIEPRLVARLRVEGFESALWTGYACLTGNGRYIAATFGPAEMVNDQTLRDRGGFLAVIDVAGPNVEMVAERVALKYHSPGCGPDGEVAAVRHLGKDAERTEVLSIDAATGEILQRQSVEAHLSFPAPSGSSVYAAWGNSVVSVEEGSVRPVVEARAQAVDLHRTNNGGVDFLVYDGDTVDAHRIDGRDAVTNAPDAIASGDVGTVSWAAGRDGNNRLVLSASAAARASSVTEAETVTSRETPSAVALDGTGTFSVSAVDSAEAGTSAGDSSPDPATANEATSTLEITELSTGSVEVLDPDQRGVLGVSAAANVNDPTCAVPRNDPNIQVMQPSPEQVEWAVHRAVRGELNIRRGRNWNSNGLPAYRPQSAFPRQALDGGGRIPAQVLLGVLAQESNMWQAARGALPGVAANPIIGNYYGVVTVGGRIVDMDFDDSDCGYGIGQITDHMTLDDNFYTDAEKLMIATDYAANIAVSQQILASKWNELRRNGLISDDADPAIVENWYLALWAYNTGFRSNAEHSGLGWTNNPANSDWRFDRRYFLRAGLDDAKTPGDWAYQERVLGFVETGLFLYGERAFTPISGLLTLPLDLPSTDVSRFEFCTAANSCDPDHSDPGGEPVRGDRSFCTRADRQCWWSQPSPFEKSAGSLLGTRENPTPYSSGPEPAVQTPYPGSCTGGASALPEPTLTEFPADAVIVDNLPRRAPTLGNCGRVQTAGSFEFILGGGSGSALAQIDLHQLGTGYEGHLWYAHTNDRNRTTHEVLGRWTPPRRVRGWQRILVHIPAVAADTYQADYRIFDGTERPGQPSKFHRVVNQRWNEARWIDLGVFNLQAGAKVELSNGTDNDWDFDINGGRDVDIAWDSIAFIPESGPPDIAYVSLGDSYTAGEGGETYFRNADAGARSANVTNACHRSVRAYSPLVYERMAAEDANDRTTFAFLACSGALTVHISGTEYQWGEVPQLAQGWIDENTTHVSIGIGGNDAGFADILIKCLDVRSLQDSCEDDALEDGEPPMRIVVPGRIESLRQVYRNLIRQVRISAPAAEITFVGYPDVINLNPRPFSICDNLLTPRERQWFDEMVILLNGVISDVANEFDFVNYAHIRDEFQGHEACTTLPTRQWINAFTVQFCDSCKLLPSAASFHPNDKGHAATGPIVYATFNE